MKPVKLLLFSCCFATLIPLSDASDADYLTYERFISKVEAGSVKAVSLDRFSQITGTYTEDGTERPFRTYGDTGSANDVLLTRLLNQKNVAVTLKVQKERSGLLDGPGLFGGLLMFLVPLVTLVLAIRINSKLNRLKQ